MQTVEKASPIGALAMNEEAAVIADVGMILAQKWNGFYKENVDPV